MFGRFTIAEECLLTVGDEQEQLCVNEIPNLK